MAVPIWVEITDRQQEFLKKNQEILKDVPDWKDRNLYTLCSKATKRSHRRSDGMGAVTASAIVRDAHARGMVLKLANYMDHNIVLLAILAVQNKMERLPLEGAKMVRGHRQYETGIFIPAELVLFLCEAGRMLHLAGQTVTVESLKSLITEKDK